MNLVRIRTIVGWAGVLLNSVFACVWSFWGIIENFHEGWYYDSLMMNIGLMVIQYLSFAMLLIVTGLISLRWNVIGGGLFIIIAGLIPFKFDTAAAWFIFSIPMASIGVFYLFGRIQRTRPAIAAIVCLPAIVMFSFGIEPLYRITNRSRQDSTESVVVPGNGIELTWAPAGPGWPASSQDLVYDSWEDVVWTCAHLTEDGKSISDTAVNLWRLPTVEEVARSLTRNGENAGGIWNRNRMKATYRIKPDKEPPLWRVNSPIIYWWTSTEVSDSTVCRIVYNGSVQQVGKRLKMGSLGFRAVKQAKEP